jgi:hypothetical protein
MHTAIIIEPRKHRALHFVLKNFLDNLSKEWNVIVFHGNQNIDYVNAIVDLTLSQYKDRINLINLNVDNLSRDEYSELLKTNRFIYDNIPSETFLIFQTDTMIFSRYKNFINYFLKYDYVGAPWPYEPRNNGHNVGNGGLSLRKKSKMLEIMDKESNLNLPEDVFFSCTSEVDLYKPSLEEAKYFSVENIFSKRTFGSHQPWILKNEMIRYYPEVKQLFWLNNKPFFIVQNQSTIHKKRLSVFLNQNRQNFFRSRISRFIKNKRVSSLIPRNVNYHPQIRGKNMRIRAFR